MPVGRLKNTVYGLALPVLGRRCVWKTSGYRELDRVLKRHRVAGTAIQCFEKGCLADCYEAGYATQENGVCEKTIFRTASVAKMVTALLVFRLQTRGLLNVREEVSAFLGYPVRNPYHPEAPVTLGMVLSHTSSIIDSPAYFASFQQIAELKTLLEDPQAWMMDVPGTRFRYSNMAAGMVGCMLERRFGMSLEALAQQELFQPLQIEATFDLSTVDAARLADSWRVLPPALAFDGQSRRAAAKALNKPDPQHHYLLASGSLYLTAEALARLTLVAWNGAESFLDQESLHMMHKPLMGWPDQTVGMRHGMGLFLLDDPSVCPKQLWGHEGFAYGAVNGVFFDAEGSGFVSLNSGASEQRVGHLACLNRDLIAWWMKERNK